MTDVPCVSTQFRHTPAICSCICFANWYRVGGCVSRVFPGPPGVFYRDVDCDLMLVNVTCTM